MQLHYVERVCKIVRHSGMEAIALKKMGRPVGSNEILTFEQEEEIQKTLLETTPDTHKYRGFLWDNRLIRQLIKDKWGLKFVEQPLTIT